MFGKKKAEEESKRIRAELDRKYHLETAYLNELRRKDRKYNFVFLPYLNIANEGYQHLYVYGKRTTNDKGYMAKYIKINDIVIKCDHADQLQLSLKPGKYTLEVYYDAAINLLNHISSVLEKQNPGVTFYTYKDLYRCEIEKKCTFVVNDKDICYVLFKGEVTPKYSRSKNLLFMDSYTHSYEMRQTSFEHIKSMIPKVWVDDRLRYQYDEIDQFWINEAYKEYGEKLSQYKDIEIKPIVSKTINTPPKVEKLTLKYPNGNEYVGETINDIPNGKGTYYYKSGVNAGCSIEGNFLNGRIDGLATIRYKDGSYYIGQFKENLKHGKGTLYKVDGNKEEYEYEEGKLKSSIHDIKSVSSTRQNVNSTFSNTSSNIKTSTATVSNISSKASTSSEIRQLDDYYGEVVNNKKNGLGISFIASIYSTLGIYKNDEVDGPFLEISNDKIYIGLEQNNLSNKFCMETSSRSFKFKDNFPFKVLFKSIFIKPEKMYNSLTKETKLYMHSAYNYVGTNSNINSDGLGIRYNVAGKIHFGEFKNGKLNGYGMIYDDNTLYIGQLKDGVYNGVGMLVNNYKSSTYTTTIGNWINGKFDK